MERGPIFRTWNGDPIALPWRQGLCANLMAVVVLAVFGLSAFLARPDAAPTPPLREKRESARSAFPMMSVASRMAAFTVTRPETPAQSAASKDSGLVHGPSQPLPAAAPESAASPMGVDMADGEAFPLIINIPAGAAWREVFRTYGGVIGVSNSSSQRPAYLSHTISPDGRVDEESVPTIGRFLFRLSDEAIRIVNDTVEPEAQIPPGQSAFAVFGGPFRTVVARVLQEFCTTEHVSPDDLAVVQLELGTGFGLRVASTTRRAAKF